MVSVKPGKSARAPATRTRKIAKTSPLKTPREIKKPPAPSPMSPPVGTREQWYPLSNDPGLFAAGVEVGTRVTVRPKGPPQLRIVFRAGGKEAEVTCVHVAVYAGSLESLPPDRGASPVFRAAPGGPRPGGTLLRAQLLRGGHRRSRPRGDVRDGAGGREPPRGI